MMDAVKATGSASSSQIQGNGPLYGYHIYSSFADAACLKHEWDDLASRAGDIHCSFDWCEVWWKHFGAGRRLEIHTWHDGAQLVAVLPLFRETVWAGAVRLRTVRVLGCDYTTGTVGLAVEPAHAERFAAMLLRHLDEWGAWDILYIADLRSYAVAIEAIATACANDRRTGAVFLGRQGAWLTIFHLPRRYEEFLDSLSSKVRSDTHRRERRLIRNHTVEFAAVTEPEQVAPAMDALVRLHQKRWTDRGKPGQLHDQPVQAFHRELAQRLCGSGQLVLLTLRVDGHIVSVGYGYRFGRRTHPLIVGHSYDPQWKEYGLGRIMHCHLIRDAIEHGSCELEDGRGVFDYKLRLGGTLHGEPSLAVVHSGWTTRLRLWTALHMAYAVHLCYSRLWLDVLAPAAGIQPTACHFHVRNRVLAQLSRQVRWRLFGRRKIIEMRRVPYPTMDWLPEEPHAH